MRRRPVPFVLVAQGPGIVAGSAETCARVAEVLGLPLRRVAIREHDLIVAVPLATGAAPYEELRPGSAGIAVALNPGADLTLDRKPSASTDAWILHDSARRAWTIGRGRTGVRTLYYRVRSGGRASFAASTQLRALLPFLDPSPALDRDAIRRYLCNGFFSDPETPFVDLRSLLPGEVLERRDGESAWRSIAAPEPASRPRAGDGRAPGEIVRERLVQAVEARTSDLDEVPCLLSGGVDSSTVAAVAAKILGKKVRTYSLVFEDEELSEAKYATAVAARIGAVHENVLLRQEEFEGSLDWLLGALDLPTADAVNSLLISRAIARNGHDAALCGVGSDELFGGHECMRRVPRALSFLRSYRRAPGFARAAFRSSARLGLGIWSDPWLPSRGLRGKFLELLDEPEDPLSIYLLSRRVLVPAAVERLVPARAGAGEPNDANGADGGDGFRSVPAAVAGRFAEEVRAESLTRKLSFFERHIYLSNQLVRDLGMVAVATGLDVRIPFLDRDLVDAVWSLPESEVFLEGRPKTFLIRSVKDVLPVEAYDRPKLGFVLPIGRWLDGAIAARLERLTAAPRLLESLGVDARVLERIVRDCASARGKIFFTREWCLFVLLDWCSRNLRHAGAI